MYTVHTVCHRCGLDRLQLRALFKDTLGFAEMPSDDHVLTGPECFVVWVAALLGRLAFLSPEQRLLIMDEAHGAFLQMARSSPGPEQHLLAIADGRFVTWTGLTGYLDLRDGRGGVELPSPALETLAYNLTVLYDRSRRQADARVQQESRDAHHHADAAEQTG